MAIIHAATSSLLSSFLHRFSATKASNASRFTSLSLRQPRLLISSRVFAHAVPSALSLDIPRWLEGLWDSILRAVPKKKTSHMKKRSRQRAGKALKDVTALNTCSGCGHTKRAHHLCPYCVKDIKDVWKRKATKKNTETPVYP